MQIHLIWAQAHHRVIGQGGLIPWHLPQDLAHFKRTTQSHPVIMGRKTWDSLPPKFRPLPGRLNVVLSTHAEMRAALGSSGATAAQNLDEALSLCKQLAYQEVWIIGGAQIYAQALPIANKLIVTEIDASYDGDTYAPALSDAWQEVDRQSNVSADGVKFAFVTYRRK